MSKKIMFSDKYGLTQAVLEGRKTMTRRVCKHNRPNGTYEIVFPVFGPNDFDNDGNNISPLNYAFGWMDNKANFIGWNIPQYKVGEVVAIAQSYKDAGYSPDKVFYRSFPSLDMYGKELASEQKGWTNKMFVAASLMPHHIRITDVKLERLQDISDEGCIKEGIYPYYYGNEKEKIECGFFPDGFSFDGIDCHYPTPREAYASLIDKVSGKGVWDKNPFVFVYEFELID